jgi:hypothetical protein
MPAEAQRALLGKKRSSFNKRKYYLHFQKQLGQDGIKYKFIYLKSFISSLPMDFLCGAGRTGAATL